jgi:hypothetical protein
MRHNTGTGGKPIGKSEKTKISTSKQTHVCSQFPQPEVPIPAFNCTLPFSNGACARIVIAEKQKTAKKRIFFIVMV